MKKFKISLICTLLVISALVAIPSFGVAQGPGWGFDWRSENPEDIASMPEGLMNGLGNVFGMLGGLGPSGQALGEVFKILFMNIFNFTFVEDEIKHVYKLSASYERTETYNVTHSGEEEYYFIWEDMYPATSSGLTPNEHPYVKITRTGNATITYTSGAAVVFIIWDNNDSLINAINKIITAAQNVKAIIDAKGDPSTWTEEDSIQVGTEIAEQILSALTYVFFHINDIISGDELIVLNMITWEEYDMQTSSDYAVVKEYLVWDDWDLSDDTPLNPADIAQWGIDANANNDEFMQWLLTAGEAGLISREWSRLSFNLIEIWFKTFQININVSAIVDALVASAHGEENPLEDMGVAQIFHGLDIEIYIMTHSLMGFIAYEDVNTNNVPDVERTTIVEGEVETDIITGSEARYYFAFGNIDPIFHAPVLNAEGTGYEWSIELQNVQMAAIPIGMNPSDVATPVLDTLDYIELGFTFTPKLKETVTATEAGEYSGLVPEYDEVQMAKGIIKLDQYFSDWNDGAAINPELVGLDFSVIYISTIIHFRLHFEVETLEEIDINQDGLLDETDHAESINVSGQIKVGDYTGDLPVAAVDIAGPDYEQGLDEGVKTSYAASTCTIPLAFLDFDANAQMKYYDVATPSQSFQAGGFLNITASILIYAVNYPTWNGSGQGLWHDPTFSIFMSWDNPGFWAVILVIAGITLVAVAAILITRRKNRV